MNEDLSFRTQQWVSRLRCLPTTTHYAVAHIFANETASGTHDVVPMLRHNRIADILGISYTTARRTVYDFIHWKMIRERKKESIPNRGQTANFYRLDLEQFHPPDEIGPSLWKQLSRKFIDQLEEESDARRFSVYADTCSACFDIKRQILYVWPDQGHPFRFLKLYTPQLLHLSKRLELKPTIRRIELVP